MRRAARRAIRWLAFGGRRIASALDALCNGLVVASLTREDLGRLTVEGWEAFGRQTPEEADLFGWEKTFFAAHVNPGDTILVVGAGTGRDVMPFLEAGHHVTAVDIATLALARLRSRAEARSLAVDTIEGSIVSVSLPANSFDVVVFSWWMFGYIPGDQRPASLSRARKALRPGGRILLSYQMPAEGGSGGRSLSRLVSRAAGRLLRGLVVEQGDTISVSGSLSRPLALFCHTFTPAEVEEEGRRASLRVSFHDQIAGTSGRIVLVGD